MNGDLAARAGAADGFVSSASARVLLASLGVVAFILIIDLSRLLALNGKSRDVLVFLAGGVALGPLCGWAYRSLFGRAPSGKHAGALESGLIWAATGAFLALVVVQTAAGLGRLPSLWETGAQAVLFLTPPAALLITWGARAAPTAERPPSLLRQRSFQAGAFTVASALAIVSLFWFEPGGTHWSGLIAFPTSHPFAEASRAGWMVAVLVSSIILAAVGFLVALQVRLALRAPARLRAMERLTLGLAIVLVIVFLFDFSLNLEVLHYLTNVGPAIHMLHGGVPLVDTFSQYGPGPVVATGLAYLVAPLTLGTAQLVVQLFNLAFFAVWLVCLYRLSSYRMAAVILGIAAAAVQLAVWDFGSGNINVAPSILGFRHLPTLLLVLAISLLRPPARHSLLTWFAMFVAALWSLETFIGTLGVYVGFLVFLNWRDRDMPRMLRDLAIVWAPVLLALAVIVAATLLAADSWPRFDLYARFLGVYNPFSDFWSYVASSSFFGWILPLLVTFLVLAEAALSAVRGRTVKTGDDGQGDILFYRFLPMALSILPISAYFAFRSHDYTLAVTLLPTLALLIAGGLPATVQLAAGRGPAAALLAIPILFCLGSVTYALLALGSPKAAYSFALQECRDHGRCTPSALAAHLHSRLKKREVLEPVGNIFSDRWIGYLKPAGVLSEAIDLLSRDAVAQPQATVLLGNGVASELALLYTDKWQHFPISFAFTDQLVPAIAQHIVTAPVRLPPGSLVLVGPEAALSTLELAIWKRIQSEVVQCPLPATDSAAYRVAGGTNCDGS